MKKLKSLLLVVLAMLLLAGESYSLMTAKTKYDYEKARDVANGLQEDVLKISVSIRNGEMEQFSLAKASYEEKLGDFQSYAEGSNAYARLEAYQDWLNSPELEKLIIFNASIKSYNIIDKNSENALEMRLEALQGSQEGFGYSNATTEDITKITKLIGQIRDCRSYCLAEDYEKLKTSYDELENKLSADWQKINDEYSARMQSEAVIESLEEF